MAATQNLNTRKLVPLLLDWFAANARDLPWRRTRDPYAIWVSEIMLQQTQVKTVIPFWNRWLCELPTIKAATKAPSAKIHKLWEGLGYYMRVRNLQKAAQVIMKKHGGIFPENFNDVLALPGIGRYTAGAICSIAFNQPTAILDGNVIRVLTRIFGIAENPKEKQTNAQLWQLAEELVTHAARLNLSRSSRREEAHFKIRNPKSEIRNSQSLLTSAATIEGSCSALNQSLMELGALVCTPRNPQCLICPVKKLCVAFKENRVEELPNLGKREAATVRRFIAFAMEHNGKFLVRQRPAGVVNAHLWEFPNVEVAAGILPDVEPGVPPGGKNSQGSRRLKIFLSPLKRARLFPGGKMPPSTAGGTPAATTLAAAAKNLGFEFRDAKPLCTVKHSITRYRITLEALSVRLEKFPAKMEGVWKTPAQMRQLAFTSAHKKVIGSLGKRC